MAPAATNAENSPKECPATISGLNSSPNAFARITECRNIAGCVTLVCLNCSSVPANIISVMRKPSISSAFSNIALQLSFESYSSLPIPTNCAPCPGNTYAFFISLIVIVKQSAKVRNNSDTSLKRRFGKMKRRNNFFFRRFNLHETAFGEKQRGLAFFACKPSGYFMPFGRSEIATHSDGSGNHCYRVFVDAIVSVCQESQFFVKFRIRCGSTHDCTFCKNR